MHNEIKRNRLILSQCITHTFAFNNWLTEKLNLAVAISTFCSESTCFETLPTTSYVFWVFDAFSYTSQASSKFRDSVLK